MNKYNFLTAVLLAACAISASAQGDRDRDRYAPNAVSALVDRVHTDLDHAYGAYKFSKSDRDRLNRAEKELREFSKKWNNGKFDKGELDDAIGSIQHVLDNNHLTGRERDALSDDATQLRGMREAYDRHELGPR